MTKEQKKQCKEYAIRRDKALNADFEAFKEWIYSEPFIDKTKIPESDWILRVAMHKMRLGSLGVWPKKKEESKKYLKEHGLKDMFGREID